MRRPVPEDIGAGPWSVPEVITREVLRVSGRRGAGAARPHRPQPHVRLGPMQVRLEHESQRRRVAIADRAQDPVHRIVHRLIIMRGKAAVGSGGGGLEQCHPATGPRRAAVRHGRTRREPRREIPSPGPGCSLSTTRRATSTEPTDGAGTDEENQSDDEQPQQTLEGQPDDGHNRPDHQQQNK